MSIKILSRFCYTLPFYTIYNICFLVCSEKQPTFLKTKEVGLKNKEVGVSNGLVSCSIRITRNILV